MKKIFTYIAIIALAALTAGCAKESDIQDKELAQASGEETTLTVTLNVPVSETKTTLGSKSGSTYPILWSAGDVITLNGTAATEFTPASGNASATAKFKVDNLTAPYNFLYRGVAGQSNQVSFPATQVYVAGGFDPAAMPMYASVSDLSSSITFSHVGSLLKFSIKGSKKIGSVTLSAKESLSGTFTIGKTGGLLNGTLTPASSGASLMYVFGSPIQLSSTPVVFYVAIPAGTYEDGISLDILDNESGHMTLYVMTEAAKKTIEAGKVREFSTVEYVPETEKNLIVIKNETTFNEFVTTVAGGNKTVNARLTQSLTLSNSTINAFNSIEDYKGTFDGTGKTISGLTKPMFDDLLGVVKNLTLNSTISTTSTDRYWGIFAKRIIPTLEIDDIPGLQNCTASGTITWAPSSAIDNYMALGGLVGDNKGGTITGCTNNAKVTFASSSVTHTNQPSVGGVVGRTQKGGDLKTQGEISNCTNNGEVICAAQFSQGAYIGGVLGYQVEKAETMSGCVNHGLVKVTSTFSTSGALHLGGVAGMAKGTMENCTNSGDGVVTSEACSVSSYLCQGGVVGRLNGTATYETLTNAGTLNVAALGGSSGRLIGGVVGRCQEGATLNGVTNSGDINYTAEATNETHIGGVVADNVQSDIILQNCNSTGGKLTFSSASHSKGIYVGGVVGYSTKAVTSCSNAMTIKTTGSMSMGDNNYICFGGVIGYLSGAILATNCTNSGTIDYGQTVNNEGQTYVGGVVGALTNGEIYGGGNTGTINFTGQNTKRPPSVGGIVGRVFSNTTDSGYALNNNVTNSGEIIVNSSVSGSQYMYLGGLVGQHLAGNIYGTNNAPITVTELHESMMALGGIVGYLAGGTVYNGTNTANGDIAVNGFISGYHSYVGGIVGMASGGSSIAAGGGTITGASNAGDVTIGSGCTIPNNHYVGGVIGYAGNSVSSASNTGAIVNNYSKDSGDKTICIAGVAAYSVASLSSCYNTGNVTNNGSTFKGEINVAGVVGVSEGSLSSCSNGTNSLAGGTITNTATSGTNSRKSCKIAGVVAYYTGSTTATNCFNKGAVMNSGASLDVSIAGVSGYSKAALSSCYNTGDITNEGTTSKGEINVAGVVGICEGDLTSCSNGTNSLAGGTITNTATSGTTTIQDGQFAGIVANNKGNTNVTSCFNKGAVVNSGACSSVSIAGIAAWTSAGSTYTGCYNTGNITNEGTGSNSTAGVRMGGIAGSVNGASTFTGNSTTYNYNSGILYEHSASEKIAVGGICGYTFGAASDFAYAKNLSTQDAGDIKLEGGTRDKIYVGGIIGMSAVTSSFNYANNAGKILFKDMTMSATGQLFAGGILGGWTTSGEQTITGCVNSGRIECDSSDHNDLNVGSTATPLWSCIGGISGMGSGTDEGLTAVATITGKTFTNCTNSGYIWFYSKVRACIGGIIAYSEISPSNCVCTGWIQVHKSGGIGTVNGNYHRQAVGGIIGYCSASTISNLKFEAERMYTTGNSPFAYSGGIVGLCPQNTTFVNCQVGVPKNTSQSYYSISAAGNSNGSAALFCRSGDTGKSYSFTNCKVKDNTRLYYGGTGSNVNTYITSSNININYCAGPNGSLAEGGTLPSVVSALD